jgi:hypothetical protein
LKNSTICVLICAALLYRCSPEPLTGGTIDTGNAKIAARIHTSDGGLAAAAAVTFCPAGYLPEVGVDSATNSLGIVKETATDDSGYFSIDTPASGAYRIEVNDGQSAALILDVVFDSSSQFLEDTLRPYASVEGNAGALAAASIKRYVLVYGTNRRVAIANNGSFSLHDLPQGTFRFRIVAEHNEVAPVDLDSVITRSKDTVSMPFAGWLHSAKINLNTTASGADVTGDEYGFPVLIRLSKNNFHFDQAARSGSDCRFANPEGNSLAFEIEQWDSVRGAATIWVRVDTVFGNNEAQSFLMFWGNPRVAPIANGGTVFDTGNGFMCVYHFNGNVNDATLNRHNGTDNNTVDAEVAMAGRGRGFNGSPQHIQLGDLPDRPSGTISCWMKPNVTVNFSTATTQGIWGKKTSDSLDFTLSLRGTDFYAVSGGAKAGGPGSLFSKLETTDSGYYLASSTSAFSAGVWYYISWSWGNGDNNIYVN